MKTFKTILSAIPFAYLAALVLCLSWSSSYVSAADLDSYYLERFGELPKPDKILTGVVHSSEQLPMERCYTPVVHSLRQDWPKLAAGTRQVLAKYLAKPTLTAEAQVRSAEGYFNIHYATSGTDAPPLADSNGNGIPDWVESVAAVFDAVYRREVLEMGYTAAPTGGGAQYDVYLQDLKSNYLGLTNSGSFVNGNSASSTIVIDNDFTEFRSYDPLKLLKITAAHEYQHAIQYGYHYYFDVWYAEATSTWIEDEVFDSINQTYEYIPTWFNNSRLPLNAPVSITTGGGYSRWLFNRYIAEISGTSVIRRVWELLRATPRPTTGSDIDMIPLINSALGGRLDEYMIGFGKRIAFGNWLSHKAEVKLIHPFVTEPGAASPALSAYPSGRYSFVFLGYGSNSLAQNVDLSLKPASVAAVSLNVSSTGVLLLSSNLTGSTIQPADPLTTSDGVPDSAISTAKSPILVSGPAVSSTGGNVSSGSNSSSSSVSGDSGGGGCFIATAAYGSYMHEKVMVLRVFRDRWLLTNPPGRMMVKFYYRISPPVAAIISRHAWMKFGCRVLLTPLIAALEHPVAFAPIVLGLFGWGFMRRRTGFCRLS